MTTLRTVIVVFILALSVIHTKAQVGINIDQPHPSAIFHLHAADKGFLVPRLEEQGLVTDPADGLVFYHTGNRAYYIYNGHWRMMVPFDFDNDTIKTGYHMKTSGSFKARGPVNIQGPVTITNNIEVRDTVTASCYALNATGNGPVPKGAIIMWSGAEIPYGWALCDGTNGTPDLRGRFIVGYHPEKDDYNNPGDISEGGTYAGNRGGETTHKLTISEMPRHNHGGGKHNHNIRHYDLGTGMYDPDLFENIIPQVETSRGDKLKEEPDIKDLIRESNEIIDSEGEGEPHENRPPYYVLAYIMKL